MKKLAFLIKTGFLLLILNTSALYAQQGTVTINQNPQLKTVLAVKNQLDRANKTSKYKIQLANGSKNHVNTVLGRFSSKYPNVLTHIVYESPEYKVRVGSYHTKLEAERALIGIREEFPNAIIIKL